MAKHLKYLDPAVLSRLKNMSLRARFVVEGFITGMHRSPYHGFSVEFSEHRQYMPGDEPKHIDWKLYGKTDRHYIKQFEEETNLKAYILLDASASMGYSSGGITKLEYGSYLAASLIYMMLRQRDAVGLCEFDEKIRSYIPPSSRASYLKVLLEKLESITPGSETNLANTFHELAERIRRRGLIIIISDFLDEPEKILQGLKHFRYRMHEVIVFHLMDPAELDFEFTRDAIFRDIESGVKIPVDPWHIKKDYKKKVGEFVDAIRTGCRAEKIDYVLMRTSDNLGNALSEFLNKRKRIGG